MWFRWEGRCSSHLSFEANYVHACEISSIARRWTTGCNSTQMGYGCVALSILYLTFTPGGQCFVPVLAPALSALLTRSSMLSIAPAYAILSRHAFKPTHKNHALLSGSKEAYRLQTCLETQAFHRNFISSSTTCPPARRLPK